MPSRSLYCSDRERWVLRASTRNSSRIYHTMILVLYLEFVRERSHGATQELFAQVCKLHSPYWLHEATMWSLRMKRSRNLKHETRLCVRVYVAMITGFSLSYSLPHLPSSLHSHGAHSLPPFHIVSLLLLEQPSWAGVLFSVRPTTILPC